MGDDVVSDRLSHVDAEGRARMVNVGGKPITRRRAVAAGWVRCSAELLDAVRRNALAKGNLIDVARLAGVMGAKRTGELIPLCHPLSLDHVDVQASVGADRIALRASVETEGRTGVEMEALAAIAIAGLTVIDMGKAVDPGMVLEGVRLIEKTGGKRDYRRPDEEA
jgi:cyclic pyranopterin monophosphate synthase